MTSDNDWADGRAVWIDLPFPCRSIRRLIPPRQPRRRSMEITPSGQTLGARIEGVDLGAPLSDANVRSILRALGQHGVLGFPHQTFDVPAFAAFGRRFGDLEINVANLFYAPDFPEVMILSNMKENGNP